MQLLAAIVLTIVHTVNGCHVWQTNRDLGPRATLSLHRGQAVQLHVTCPMNFSLVQVSGPKLALGGPVVYTGTQRTIRFAKKGVYVLRGTNLQSSAQVGLQTLGPDNTLTLTVRVS